MVGCEGSDIYCVTYLLSVDKSRPQFHSHPCFLMKFRQLINLYKLVNTRLLQNSAEANHTECDSGQHFFGSTQGRIQDDPKSEIKVFENFSRFRF